MKIVKLFFVFFVACSHIGPLDNRPGEIPLEDFFKNPEMTSFDLSPSGQYVSYLSSYQKRLNIFIRRSKEFDQEKRLTSIIDRNINSYFWKDEKTIIFFKDTDGDENDHAYRLDLRSLKVVDLTPGKEEKSYLIHKLTHTHPNHVLLASNIRDKKFFDVYRVNVRTGDRKLIIKNEMQFTSYLLNKNGEVVGARASDGVNRSFYLKQNRGWTKLLETNFKDSFYPLIVEKSGASILALSNLNRDKMVLVRYDLNKLIETKVLYSQPDYDIDDIHFSDKRWELDGVDYVTWKKESYFFNPKLQKLKTVFEKHFPDSVIKVTQSDLNEENYIVIVYSDRNSGSYYRYNVQTEKMNFLTHRMPWLNEKMLAKTKPFYFEARDGLKIEGYLTVPSTRVENKPMLVLPHGGPWSRDSWEYSPKVQFFANRGYRVLQINFRGSTGYGKDFWMKSFKKWGKEMQNDITDAVGWAISQGHADKDKICIFGGSYGGYATLAGLAFTPDLYACGIDYVGVSNLFTLLSSIPPYWEAYRAALYEKVGDPQQDKELLTAASPLFHVDKIKAPLLVVQGANDPRVKQAESDQIVNALRKRGIEVPYILKQDEGHGFRNEENKIELYTAIEKFLKRHIGI